MHTKPASHDHLPPGAGSRRQMRRPGSARALSAAGVQGQRPPRPHPAAEVVSCDRNGVTATAGAWEVGDGGGCSGGGGAANHRPQERSSCPELHSGMFTWIWRAAWTRSLDARPLTARACAACGLQVADIESEEHETAVGNARVGSRAPTYRRRCRCPSVPLARPTAGGVADAAGLHTRSFHRPVLHNTVHTAFSVILRMQRRRRSGNRGFRRRLRASSTGGREASPLMFC